MSGPCACDLNSDLRPQTLREEMRLPSSNPDGSSVRLLPLLAFISSSSIFVGRRFIGSDFNTAESQHLTVFSPE